MKAQTKEWMKLGVAFILMIIGVSLLVNSFYIPLIQGIIKGDFAH